MRFVFHADPTQLAYQIVSQLMQVSYIARMYLFHFFWQLVSSHGSKVADIADRSTREKLPPAISHASSWPYNEAKTVTALGRGAAGAP
jgi:hypothetical protein